jgi:hypothetical protein
MKTLLKAPMQILKITAIVLVALILLVFSLRGSMASIEFGNDFTRDAVAHSILADRDKTIGQLEDVVKQDVNNPVKKKAVQTSMILLGMLRADEAAPLLASHLLFRVEDQDSGNGLRLHSFDELYPAVGALVKIGVPALDSLLYQASNTDDRKDDFLTNYVLVTVLGQRPAIAFVSDTIQAQREQKRRQRLNILLISLRKYPPLPRQNLYL